MKPPTVVDLVWKHDLVLDGTSGSVGMTLDSGGHAGPSPMQTLGFALAGCMAMDLVHILKKGRFELRALSVHLLGHREQEEPPRFTRFEMQYTLSTNAPREQIQRAIDLSREKYCSVWHSLREDIGLTVTFDVISS